VNSVISKDSITTDLLLEVKSFDLKEFSDCGMQMGGKNSAQSRADVLVLALATTALLQGLVWKSIQPRAVISVEMEGVECFRIAASLPQAASQELQWVWEALSSTTRSQALVVVYGDACALQAGMAAESGDASGDAQTIDVHQLLNGSLCRQARETETQNYLANLALYPGRFELLFLPSNTQVKKKA
jgi:hypothetical protein